MKGYKAFDKDLKCRDFQFEIGKTYKHNGNIELCKSGFHFCRKCADCHNYYQQDARICEVEAIGEIIESKEDSKCVTNEIKIIRELSHGEILDACNSGNWNSGDSNSGYWNSGNRNSGNWNSGDRNSGDWNSGDWNSGNWNSGNRNSGNWNSGNWNSGNWNSGDRNSGDWNSGNWNSGNWNSGYLNTSEPLVRIFDKETNLCRDDLIFPNFFFFNLNVWIEAKDMTDEEQKEHPSWQITGGYLRGYEYKEAWKKSFDNAKASNNWEEEKRKLLALPS